MCPAGLQVCRAGVSHALKARSRSDRAWAREVAVGGVPVGVRHGRGETRCHLGNARHGAKRTVRPPAPAATNPDASGRSVHAAVLPATLRCAGRQRARLRACDRERRSVTGAAEAPAAGRACAHLVPLLHSRRARPRAAGLRRRSVPGAQAPGSGAVFILTVTIAGIKYRPFSAIRASVSCNAP